jgi:hypothetical protein
VIQINVERLVADHYTRHMHNDEADESSSFGIGNSYVVHAGTGE